MITLSRLHILVLVFILLPGCGSCFASSAPAASSAADVNKPDTRLAQKISYEAWHTPLKKILADVAQKTGVALQAGASDSDWQVRDRRMNIRVKDVSLSQLMSSIARVMKFGWSANRKKDPPTYRLSVDRRLLGELQAEASRRQDELKAEESRRRLALLSEFEKLSSPSAAELDALKESNPYLYMCAKTRFAEFFTRLCADEPRYRDAFVSGEKNVLPLGNVLSPSMRQLFEEVIKNTLPYDRLDGNHEKLPERLNEHVPLIQVGMRSMPGPFEGGLLTRLSDFGSVGTYVAGGDHNVGHLKDPYAASTQAWARAYVTAADANMDEEEFYKKLYPAVDDSTQKDARESEYYLMFDEVSEHLDQPDLHKKILPKLTDEIKKYRDEQIKASEGRDAMRINYQVDLQLVADAAKLNIVSDSFSVAIGGFTPASQEKEFGEVMDAFGDAFRCNWDKRGSILEVRRLDWFRRRSSQIPDEWIKSWKDEIVRNNAASLDTYFQLIDLTDEQMEENIYVDPVLAQITGRWWSCGNNRGFARFHQQLTDKQRKQILTTLGLDPCSLKPAQWQYYSEMLHYGRRYTWDTEQFADPENGQLAVKGIFSRRGDGGSDYHFRVVLTKHDGTVVETKWEVPIPGIPRPQNPPAAESAKP